MGVSLTAFAPSRCDRGHYIGKGGRVLVSWSPCLCAGAWADSPPARGHIQVKCTACADEGVAMVYYDPPHVAEDG